MTALSRDSAPLRLRIVAINDVYHLDHLPHFAGLVAHQRTHDPADLLLVTMAGDFVAPSLLSSLDAGRGMIATLNACGVTHACFGNHEDDIPLSELRARVAEFGGVWLNTNMRTFTAAPRASDVVTLRREGLAEIRVGLLGVLLNDPSAYLGVPFEGAVIGPPEEMALREAARLRHEEGCAVVVPLTHQSIAADRQLAAAAQEVPFPVILGGHEHAVFQEKIGATWVLKAGFEATTAFVIDLAFDVAREGEAASFPGGTRPEVTVRLEPVAAYPEVAEVRALVDAHLEQVRQLYHATLCLLPADAPLSSVGTRSRQTTMGTFLCDTLRDAFCADVCIFNGGGIRGSQSYEGRFTYGDLVTEMPFDNEVVVVRVPGRVLADAVAFSRRHAPAEAGRFLQVDGGVVVQADHRISLVGGHALDLDRDYLVATVRELFFGMDHLEPLMEFAARCPERMPHVGTGREAKLALVEAFARALWRTLGGYAAVDSDGDGRIGRDDLGAALTRITGDNSPLTAKLVFDVLDTNKDEIISPDEDPKSTRC